MLDTVVWPGEVACQSMWDWVGLVRAMQISGWRVTHVTSIATPPEISKPKQVYRTWTDYLFFTLLGLVICTYARHS